MADLRLFAGIVQMRQDRPGVTNLQNEHWCGWYESKDAALIDWIKSTTAKLPNHAMSYHAAHDITDIALRQLERPA